MTDMANTASAISDDHVDLITDTLRNAQIADDVAALGVRVLLHSTSNDLTLCLDPELPQWYANTYKHVDGATVIGKPEKDPEGRQGFQLYAVVQAADQITFAIKRRIPGAVPGSPPKEHIYHFYFNPNESELLFANNHGEDVYMQQLSNSNEPTRRINRTKAYSCQPGFHRITIENSSIYMRILPRVSCTMVGFHGISAGRSLSTCRSSRSMIVTFPGTKRMP